MYQESTTYQESVTLGTCSICGGRVVVPKYWACTIPAVPTCECCGARAAGHGKIIPMIPTRQPIYNAFDSINNIYGKFYAD